MTVGTQKILLLSIPISSAPAVNASSPIPEFGTVALATQLVGFLEIDQFASSRVQHVSVIRVMAVYAPPVFLVVREDDVIMEIFQLPPLEV